MARPIRFVLSRVGLLTAALMLPVLLLAGAPLLGAFVPSAIVAAASVRAGEEAPALGEAEVVSMHDGRELARIAAATPIPSKARRVA